MKKLSIVIPALNQKELLEATYKQLRLVTDTTTYETEFLIIDNGSSCEFDVPGAEILRNEKTVGVYPTFKQGFEHTTGDIVAFFHSDVVIWEKFWNDKVIEEFDKKPKLGMIGFIGSNEIDTAGGRGLGTTSNFQGKSLDRWTGSPASVHGKHSTEFSKAAVVDGCVMIISREAWNKIGYRENFPPHHFYDRLISTQLLENGYEIGVLGIEFDHFSGQTVSAESEYHKMAKQWCVSHGLAKEEDVANWDEVIYKQAEKMWLTEYRWKNLVPYRV